MFRVKHASWFEKSIFTPNQYIYIYTSENIFSPQTSIYICTPVKICFHPKPVYIYLHQWKYVFTTKQWKSLHTSENMCTRILENIYSPVCHNIICVCVCVCVCVCHDSFACAMTHSHVSTWSFASIRANLYACILHILKLGSSSELPTQIDWNLKI